LKNNKTNFMFRNRTEAGMLLAEKLKKYKREGTAVLAVPRGGVPVAYHVAKELECPLDIVLTKKIGHPVNKEYAIGAAGLTDYFVIPHENVPEEYIRHEVKKIRHRLKEMYSKFMPGKEPEDVKDKTVLVIDDGIATGNTMLGIVSMLRKQQPAKIVIAVPVASAEAVKKLSGMADEVIVLLVPEIFYGVGAFYEDFEQVNDLEVMLELDKMRELKKAG